MESLWWLESTSRGHLIQPPKQSQLKQLVQDCVQLGFEYLWVWRFHNLPGKPVPGFQLFHLFQCFTTLTVKGVGGLKFKGNILYFSLGLLLLVLSLDTTEKSPPVFFLFLFSRYLYTKILSHLLQHEQSWPLSLWNDRNSSPLIIFVSLWWTNSSLSAPLLYWKTQSWTPTPFESHQRWAEGRIISSTCWQCFSWDAAGFHCMYSQLMSNLFSNRAFYPKLFST